MTEPIVLHSSELKENHGQFDCRMGDRVLCVSSSPLVYGCRVLLDEGVDPETPVHMYGPGDREPRLISKIAVGRKAKMT